MTTVSDEEYRALLASLHESSRIQQLTNSEIPKYVANQTEQQTVPKIASQGPNNPYVEITEQPQSHGVTFLRNNVSEASIYGESSTAERKSFPSIQICNYEGPVIVVVSCVTKDEIPLCKPHPHMLVGQSCRKGVCSVKFKHADSLLFPHIRIKRTDKNDIASSLMLREAIRVDPFQTGFYLDLDLDVVRLCFQAFLLDGTGKRIQRVLTPVVSHLIYHTRFQKRKARNCITAKIRPNELTQLFFATPWTQLCRKVCWESFRPKHAARRNLSPIIITSKERNCMTFLKTMFCKPKTPQNLIRDALSLNIMNVNSASVASSQEKEQHTSRITGVAGGSVSNSNTCGIQIVEGDVAISTYVKEEVPGVSCRVVKGDELSLPQVKLSVPAKDGDSKVLVTCKEGDVKKWLYLHDDGSPEKSRTKWTFRNVVHGLMEAIMGESAESFCEFMDLLKTMYGCKLSKAYNHCLVLEFVHDNDEDAERMMKEKDNVKRLFTKFLKDIGKESTDREVEVSCANIGIKKTRQSEDGNIPSTSHSQDEDTTLSPTAESGHTRLLYGIKKELQAFSVLQSSEWRKKVKREIHFTTEDSYEEEPPLKKKKATLEEDGKCDRCNLILQQYTQSSLPRGNMFILHLPTIVINDSLFVNIETQDKSDECLKILSALRNAEGGTLLLHLDSKAVTKLTNRKIMSFVHAMCKKVLFPGEVICDVFDVERDSHNADVYTLHTERSDSIVTVDFKTKIPGLANYWDDTTPDELKPFVSGKRKIDDRKPELNGLALTKQAVNIVKLEYQQPDTSQTGQELADRMLEDLFLAEHITSCAKKRHGGSIFIGQPYNMKVESMVQGWDITGFDFEKGFEEKFRCIFQQAIEAHILVYNNPHSVSTLQAKDVFEIGLHKLNEGFIVEVAVRAVNGCVFYDPQGPEAYKIDKGIKQRIPFAIWIDNFVNN